MRSVEVWSRPNSLPDQRGEPSCLGGQGASQEAQIRPAHPKFLTIEAARGRVMLIADYETQQIFCIVSSHRGSLRIIMAAVKAEAYEDG